jgi:hypothetical protein
MAVVQIKDPMKDVRLVVRRFQKCADGILGLIPGAIEGAFFGIMVVAFIGALLGGIVGMVLRRIARGRKWLVLRVFPRHALPIACGIVAQAFYMDCEAATTGLWYGAWIGLGAGLLQCLVTMLFANFAVRLPSR